MNPRHTAVVPLGYTARYDESDACVTVGNVPAANTVHPAPTPPPGSRMDGVTSPFESDIMEVLVCSVSPTLIWQRPNTCTLIRTGVFGTPTPSDTKNFGAMLGVAVPT